jgi:predicted DsbA family dithiol-disulfide isomerase/Skp family chaperone for outer membrane proteins
VNSRCLSIVLAILAVASVSAAQTAPQTAGVVNGQAITGDQVLKAAAADLQRLESSRPDDSTQRERLQILHKALDAIVEDRMIALEAARQQVTSQQIIDAEIESNVVVPSDKEVAAFYEKNKARIPGPRDEALPQLRRQMTEQSRTRFRDALMRRLKREYGFRSYLEPLRTEVATMGHPSRGPAAAPVTIVEFSDFECPFCYGLYPTLRMIEKNYADQVRIVYRQFPLNNIHPRAQKAAEASLCAHDQGRFWEMHDSLFGFQEQLGVAALKQRAEELKLDTAAFNTCLDSGEKIDAIKADMADAAKAGVTGTPTFFVNGRMMLGNQPYAEIRTIVEDELQRAAGKK